MQSALTQASLLSSAFVQNQKTKEEFLSEWPSLLSKLVKLDLPPNLTVMLPENVYQYGITIVHALDHLKYQSLFHEPSDKLALDEYYANVHKIIEQTTALQKSLDSFRESLENEYKKTFT